MRVSVAGVGLWTPGFGSWPAFRAGSRDPSVTRPPCEGVAPTLLRGTSATTCVAIEALRQAARDGGADLATAPTFFGSCLGEVQTAVALNAMIRADGAASPMRFKNSVHNASGGIASIAHGNTRFTTSLSAGDDLVAVCLLEAVTWLALHGGEALVVLAEEEIPAPLHHHGSYPSLGVALHLRAGDGEVGLAGLRVDAAVPRAAPPAGHAGDPVAWAIPLLEALAARRAGPAALCGDGAAPWCVDVVVAE